MKKSVILTLISTILLLVSCDFTPTIKSNEGKKVDQSYLEFWYNNQVLPAFDNYSGSTKILLEMADAYKANQSEENYNKLCSQYETSFLALQDIIIFDQRIVIPNSVFNGQKTLYALCATTSPNKSRIQSLLNSDLGNKSIESILSDISEGIMTSEMWGYSALDYVLYNNDLVSQSQSKADFLYLCCKYLNYLAQKADQYYHDNQEGFITNDSFSASSSVTQVINNLVYTYEKDIRTLKLGYPIGIYSFYTNKPVSPESVEAYYHGGNLSTKLLQRSMKSVSDFYNGVSYSTPGAKLSNYSFKNFVAQYGDENYANKSSDFLFTSLNTALNSVNSLHDGIQTLLLTEEGVTILKNAYNDIQKNVGIIKSKTIPALGLTITYSDGEEGD